MSILTDRLVIAIDFLNGDVIYLKNKTLLYVLQRDGYGVHEEEIAADETPLGYELSYDSPDYNCTCILNFLTDEDDQLVIHYLFMRDYLEGSVLAEIQFEQQRFFLSDECEFRLPYTFLFCKRLESSGFTRLENPEQTL